MADARPFPSLRSTGPDVIATGEPWCRAGSDCTVSGPAPRHQPAILEDAGPARAAARGSRCRSGETSTRCSASRRCPSGARAPTRPRPTTRSNGTCARAARAPSPRPCPPAAGRARAVEHCHPRPRSPSHRRARVLRHEPVARPVLLRRSVVPVRAELVRVAPLVVHGHEELRARRRLRDPGAHQLRRELALTKAQS